MSSGSAPISTARQISPMNIARVRANDAATDNAMGRLIDDELGKALVAPVGDGV